MPEDKGQRTGLAIRYIEEGDGDPRHGSMNGYINLRCRCSPCTKAATSYLIGKRNKPRPELPADDPRHGSDTAYRYWHCKCRVCLAGHAARVRARANT